MAGQNEQGKSAAAVEFVYRISPSKEWEESQSIGHVYGGEFDKSSGFIHLSDLDQVQSTLQNFFLNSKEELYLLQIEAKKLGDGLIYELVDGSNSFPSLLRSISKLQPYPYRCSNQSRETNFL